MPDQLARLCDFCRKPIPQGARRDAVTCSQPCRQKRNRWRVGRAPTPEQPSRGSHGDPDATDRAPGARDGCPDCAAAANDGYDACDAHGGAVEPSEARPMRLAYADPPYPGLSGRYYGREEVDHAELIARLDREFDGWALSTSSAALQQVLALCPAGVRVAVWLRPSRAGRAWEPVIVKHARRITNNHATHLIPPDVLEAKGRMRGFPGALVGMKPPEFCEWVFRLLGAQLGDSLDDVFPGSGAVGKAWRLFAGDPAGRPKTSKPSRLEASVTATAKKASRAQAKARKRRAAPEPAPTEKPSRSPAKPKRRSGKTTEQRCGIHGRASDGGQSSAIYHVQRYYCGCHHEFDKRGRHLQQLAGAPWSGGKCGAKHPEREGIVCQLWKGHAIDHGVSLREKPGERWTIATHTVTWPNTPARIEEPEPSRATSAKPSRSPGRKRRARPSSSAGTGETDAERREREAFQARTAQAKRELEAEHPSRADRGEAVSA